MSGEESIVYGCIKDSADFVLDDERRQVNRRAMLTLPSADDWPFLSQEMFAIPRMESVAEHSYQTEVMHFGASYRGVEYEWEQWLKTFESLLSNMYWVSATVHLETELSGVHTFTWDSNGIEHKPGSGEINIRCEWSREGSYL